MGVGACRRGGDRARMTLSLSFIAIFLSLAYMMPVLTGFSLSLSCMSSSIPCLGLSSLISLTHTHTQAHAHTLRLIQYSTLSLRRQGAT